MKISDMISMCFGNLFRRKMRTILTVIGVVVGTLSLIHISEPTRQAEISYAVFCLKKKKQKNNKNTRYTTKGRNRTKIGETD